MGYICGVDSPHLTKYEQISNEQCSVSKREAPNFLCWHCFSDLKADSTVSFSVGSLVPNPSYA